MNKKQRLSLTEQMKKWNLRSAKAVANPIAFILEQSAKDVKDEIPTATPATIAKWQAEALSLSGLTDTEEGVRSTERKRAIDIVWDTYGGNPSGSIGEHRCDKVVKEIAGIKMQDTKAVHIDLGDPATIPHQFLARAWKRLKGK
jgi:hypothetical protein